MPNLIPSLYRNSDSVLVFPSEVIAASWARRTAELCGAVRGDRFISWDRFKERCFFRQEEQRPANRLFRSIFVHHLLEKNERKAFFSVLVPPRYRHDGELYRSTLIAILPNLFGLVEQDDLKECCRKVSLQ